MASLDIVFGYDDEGKICSRMKALLEAVGIEMIPHYCCSIFGTREYLASRKKCDWLILSENMKSGRYKTSELVWLHEEYNVQMIPLLQEEHVGTDYMKELYSGGILTAEFPTRVPDGQLPDVLVTLILRGRTHETAKVYYKILDAK